MKLPSPSSLIAFAIAGATGNSKFFVASADCDFCSIDTMVQEDMNRIFGYQSCKVGTAAVGGHATYECNTALGVGYWETAAGCEPVWFSAGPNADGEYSADFDDPCDAHEAVKKVLAETMGDTYHGGASKGDLGFDSDCEMGSVYAQVLDAIGAYMPYSTCKDEAGLYACDNGVACVQYEYNGADLTPDVIYTGAGGCATTDLKMRELGGQPCNAVFVVNEELRQQLSTNSKAAGDDGETDAVVVDAPVDAQGASAATGAASAPSLAAVAGAFAAATIALI